MKFDGEGRDVENGGRERSAAVGLINITIPQVLLSIQYLCVARFDSKVC